MASPVEEVSSSLVREYLNRKGLKRTIACMDEEHPRTEASVNSRSHLRQILNIEGLYRNNKAQNSPLKTLLEIIVQHHIKRPKNDRITSKDGVPLQSAQPITTNNKSPVVTPRVMNDMEAEDNTSAIVTSKHIKPRSDVEDICPSQPICMSLLPETDRLSTNNETGFSENRKSQPWMASHLENEKIVRAELDKKTPFAENTQKCRTHRTRRGMMTGPLPSALQDTNKKRQNLRLEVSQSRLRSEEENKPSKDGLFVTSFREEMSKGSLMEISTAECAGGHQGLWSPPDRGQRESSLEKVGQARLKTKTVKSLPSPNVADVDVSEMVLDDIDIDENLRELSKVSCQRTSVQHSFAGCPMDQHTAMKLKSLLLGSSLNSFPAEWRNQGFTFSEMHDLRYGIVQKKGGPCGVLASIQAFVLKSLLFDGIVTSDAGLQRLRMSNKTRRQCLIAAVAEVLWKAGEEKQATIAIYAGRNHFTPTRHFKSDGVLEKITCFTVDNVTDLRSFLEQHIEQFETGGFGCILMTISAILSRSIEKVREDMDVPTSTLIGAHGYCTQELVNLLLCGRAVPNVFDNDMELDSGQGNVSLLKGIKGHCDVGLLSLFEHYDLCKVGKYLKTPRFPIWVVCSESHFSVLFGLQRELLTNQDRGLDFDLYYYDGLANQQEEIRLTVSVGKLAVSCKDADTDLIPPLELCIRTRWKDALVSWNDTEPIL